MPQSIKANRYNNMDKLNKFEITFSNLQGVYFAGQSVEGDVTVELGQDMAMRGIRLRFDGKANVHWTEETTRVVGNVQTTETLFYDASEQYFKEDVLLFGMWPAQSNNMTTLPAGRHTFHFCYELPPSVPSSFEGEYGYVRYSVKGIIDRPWTFNHTTKFPFTVIAVLDLNTDPSVQEPVQDEDEKMVCCLCCASGPITADFHLERRGFVPGEGIRLYANIHNHSSRKIDKSYVELKMVTTFHANNKCQQTVRAVGGVVEEGPIKEGKSFSWDGQRQFVIPPLPPSRMVGCEIIDVEYVLMLTVEPSVALDLQVPLVILIGTIPLRQVVEQHPPRMPPSLPPPHVVGGTSAPPLEPRMPFAPPSSVPNLPPPTYRESVFGKVNVKDDDDDEHTSGNLEYTPVYAYYDWGHQSTSLDDVKN